MNDFGRLISKLRAEHGMTQDDLARELGVSKQTISNYERNKRKPGYEELEAIADAFNVPMGFFLSEQEQQEKLNQIYKSYNTLNRGKKTDGDRVISLDQAVPSEPSLPPKALSVARAYDRISDYGKSMIDAIILNEDKYVVRTRLPVVETGHDSDIYARYHAKQEVKGLETENAETRTTSQE